MIDLWAYMGGFHSPFGELISKCFFMEVMGTSCFAMNYLVINECDAPESNKTVAGTKLIRNVPNTTSLSP
jgi:hypothetical protein